MSVRTGAEMVQVSVRTGTEMVQVSVRTGTEMVQVSVRTGAERRSWVRQIMGMPISIHLRGTAEQTERQAAVDAAFAELAEVDRLFSTYRDDSEVARLRSGRVALDACSPVVRSVLELCGQASEATAGYFTAWLPGPDGVVRLDPSGLVKGWAVARAARHLAGVAGDDYYVSAGGDVDLAVRHTSGDRPQWRVGVEDPFDPSRPIAVLHLITGGVATSGTAHRGTHIIDPYRNAPATALASVTVVGPSLMWADVYATAACARGADALCFLRWPPGYHALAVTAQGRRIMTDGMAALLHEPIGGLTRNRRAEVPESRPPYVGEPAPPADRSSLASHAAHRWVVRCDSTPIFSTA